MKLKTCLIAAISLSLIGNAYPTIVRAQTQSNNVFRGLAQNICAQSNPYLSVLTPDGTAIKVATEKGIIMITRDAGKFSHQDFITHYALTTIVMGSVDPATGCVKALTRLKQTHSDTDVAAKGYNSSILQQFINDVKVAGNKEECGVMKNIPDDSEYDLHTMENDPAYFDFTEQFRKAGYSGYAGYFTKEVRYKCINFLNAQDQ